MHSHHTARAPQVSLRGNGEHTPTQALLTNAHSSSVRSSQSSGARQLVPGWRGVERPRTDSGAAAERERLRRRRPRRRSPSAVVRGSQTQRTACFVPPLLGHSGKGPARGADLRPPEWGRGGGGLAQVPWGRPPTARGMSFTTSGISFASVSGQPGQGTPSCHKNAEYFFLPRQTNTLS